MADTGTPHSIPYPVAADPPAGHTQMQALATQVATRIGFVGQSIIATEESRTNTAYGLMTTADRVQNVVVPNNGIVQVRYHATWKQSVAGAAAAAIFIGANQTRCMQEGGTGPLVIERGLNTAQSGTTYRPLITDARSGLVTLDDDDGAYTGDVSTGQLLGGQSAVSFDGVAGNASYGGAAEFFVITGGTFDISVQFKASSGSVSAKNRKLWVRVLPF